MVCGLGPCVQILMKIGAAGSHCRGSRSIEEREPELLYVFWVPARPTFADLVGMTLRHVVFYVTLSPPVAYLATRYRSTSLAISLPLSRRFNRSSRSISK